MVTAIVWRPGAARALVGVAVLLGCGCWAASASAYVYWSSGRGAVGRANLDGSSPPDQTFITGLRGPEGVAVNDRYIYWANLATNSIGRANLDGTDVRQRFIAADHPYGVTAVTVTASTNNILGGSPNDDSRPHASHLRRTRLHVTAGAG